MSGITHHFGAKGSEIVWRATEGYGTEKRAEFSPELLLAHELFHAYQNDVEQINRWDLFWVSGNMEREAVAFETQVIRDLNRAHDGPDMTPRESYSDYDTPWWCPSTNSIAGAQLYSPVENIEW